AIARRLAILVVQVVERSTRDEMQLRRAAVEEAAAAHGRVEKRERARANPAVVRLRLPPRLEDELDLRAIEHVEVPEPRPQRVPERVSPTLVMRLGRIE